MKKTAKIKICAFLPPALMLHILLLTGILQIVTESDAIPFYVEIGYCVFLLAALIYADRKYITADEELICSVAYFVSAIISAFLIWHICVAYYMSEIYEQLNPWTDGHFFRGLEWALFNIVIYVKTILFFIIRSVMSAIRLIKHHLKKQQITNNENGNGNK